MNRIEDQQINRYRELADRSLAMNIYTYSDFHSPAGAALAYSAVSPSMVTLWGGAGFCERVMVRFGDEQIIGYDEPYPISVINISPKQAKFADKLTHRDYLGALMNLGLERDLIGDICVHEDQAYVFVCERMAEYICENLTQVKHTSVVAKTVEEIPEGYAPKLVSETVTVSSLRIDGIIAKVCHLSRTDAKDLFASESVHVGGRTCTSPDLQPKEDDIISVRGYGKFIYRGVSRKTSKDRYAVNVDRYA